MSFAPLVLSICMQIATGMVISGDVTPVMADFFAEGNHYKWAQMQTAEGATFNLHGLKDIASGTHMTLEVHDHGVPHGGMKSYTMDDDFPPSLDLELGGEHSYDVDAVLEEKPLDAPPHLRRLAAEPEPEPENQFRGKRHSLLVIRLCYSNGCPGASEDEIKHWLWHDRYNNDGLYRETSYGLVSFPEELGAVITVQINGDITTCDGKRMIRDGEAAAKEMHNKDPKHPNPEDFVQVTLYNPPQAKCPWGGAAWGGSPWHPARHAFINMKGMSVIAHELGHNVGASHDSTDRDDDGVKDSEYGDGTGLMGRGRCGFTSVRRALLGYIPQSAQITHPGCGTFGPTEVALRALDLSPTPGRASLFRIPRHGGGHYYVSFRRGVGYDANMRSLYKNKVSVHVRIPRQNPLIVAMFDDVSTCKVNGVKGFGESCEASTLGWSGKTVGGQIFHLRVSAMTAENAVVDIKLPHSDCPAREGIAPEEEQYYNPALSSYIVNGRCDELGVEGYGRPAGEHGLGNENNRKWCTGSLGNTGVDDTIRASSTSNLCFNVWGGAAPNKQVRLYRCPGAGSTTANDHWEITGAGNLRLKYSPSLCLAAERLAASAKLVSRGCETSPSQQVAIVDGEIRMKSDPTLCMSLPGGAGHGTQAQLMPCSTSTKLNLRLDLRQTSCNATVTVPAHQCSEGTAELMFVKSKVKMLGCNFAHYAQYQCKGGRTTSTTTTTTTKEPAQPIEIREAGGKGCLKSNGGRQLLEMGATHSCAKFVVSGREFRSISVNGQCLDFFASQGKWGLWPCHGGSNQQLVQQGSAWCSGSRCVEVLEQGQTLSFRLRGRSGEERVSIKVGETIVTRSLTTEWLTFNFGWPSDGLYTVDFTNDGTNRDVYFEGVNPIANTVQNLRYWSGWNCGSESENTRCQKVRSGTFAWPGQYQITPQAEPTPLSWILADLDQDCTTACRNVGGSCDQVQLDSVKTAGEVEAVAKLSGHSCKETKAWTYYFTPSIASNGLCTYGYSGKWAMFDGTRHCGKDDATIRNGYPTHGYQRFCPCRAVTSEKRRLNASLSHLIV